MNKWVEQVRLALEPLSNQQHAEQMKAYMRGQFEFYGIQSTPRRTALKPLLAKSQLPDVEDMPLVIGTLWALPQREFQLVGIDLLIKYKKQLPKSTFDELEVWITQKSWWDTVDFLATHIMGALYQLYPKEAKRFLKKWRQSDDMWLRRTTILFQLKYKFETDEKLLFAIIKENLHWNEFFIQKAIGWSLREYSKTSPHTVIQFIKKQKIEGLAKREGLKWVTSQGMV